jgi:hypothetical protein
MAQKGEVEAMTGMRVLDDSAERGSGRLYVDDQLTMLLVIVDGEVQASAVVLIRD